MKIVEITKKVSRGVYDKICYEIEKQEIADAIAKMTPKANVIYLLTKKYTDYKATFVIILGKYSPYDNSLAHRIATYLKPFGGCGSSYHIKGYSILDIGDGHIEKIKTFAKAN